MPNTTSYDPGDIVLVRFPFTDLSSAKQRPAVVVSPNDFQRKHGDVIVVAVTSHDPGDAGTALLDWKSAGLLKPTWFKPLIATLSSSIVTRRLGTLIQPDRHQLSQVITTLFDPSLRI